MKKLTMTLFMVVFTVSIGLAQHTASTTQSGSDNEATITQTGDKGANNAELTQTGNNNDAEVVQRGDNPNDSPLGSAGYTNHVFLEQSGNSEAEVRQTGRDYVNLEQSGGSIAEINQDYGDEQIVRGINDMSATQTGGSELYIKQQGTLELGSSGVRRLGSELRIEQYSGSSGNGHLAEVKQRDGAYAQILQDGLSRNAAFITQDGNSDIYLKQHSANGSTADINQMGDGNLVTGLSGGSSYALQTGNGNHTLNIHQTSAFNGGVGNTAMVLQEGTGQNATITQNGSGNVTSVSQH